MPVSPEPTLLRLADEMAIRQVLARYSRGVDRNDWDLVRSCFHPDARLNYGLVDGSVDEFVAYAESGLAPMLALQHFQGQTLVDVGSDTAWCETYVWACHRMPTEEGTADLVLGARYVDGFERRGDRWAIIHRVMVTDWSRSDPVGDTLPPGSTVVGRRDRNDPSYEVPNQSSGQGPGR